MKTEIITQLKRRGACVEAVEWTKGKRDIKSAWKNCERGDWMLWLLGKTIAGEPWSDERKPLVLIACECAGLVLKYVEKGEERPRIAIETAEAWTRDEATEEAVRDAANAAYDAANAVNAAYAAYAAANAAYAACAANAANAAYVANAAYAAANAKKIILEKCATRIRKHYPNPPNLVN